MLKQNYIFGHDSWGFLEAKGSKGKLPCISTLRNFDFEIESIVCTDDTMLIQKSSNELFLASRSLGEDLLKIDLPKEEKIMKLASSPENFMILSQSGNCYYIGEHIITVIIPLTDPQNCSEYSCRLIKYFKKNKICIIDISMGQQANYFLSSEGKLYGNGINKNAQLGIGTLKNKQLPAYITDNVSRIFASPNSDSFFYTTITGNKLMAFGYNSQSMLGIDNLKSFKQRTPIEVPHIKANEVRAVVSGKRHSILITREGKTLVSGDKTTNGISDFRTIFSPIPSLENKNIVQVSTSFTKTIVKTKDNKFYGWGFGGYFSPIKSVQTWRVPKPIPIEEIKPFHNINIWCSCRLAVIYHTTDKDPIRNDLLNLYKSSKLCDIEINNVKCHKLFLNLRLQIPMNKIETSLKIFDTDQLKCLCSWVYSDYIENEQTIKDIFKKLNLKYPPQNNLKNDLLKLYKDNESKNFSILIKKRKNKIKEKKKSKIKKNKDKNKNKKMNKTKINQNVANNENEVGNELIKVHKLILFARSGLFQGLIDFQPEISQIQDYSKKSKSVLKKIVKFLYTGELNFKQNNSNEETFNELQFSDDYYQFNKYSKFKSELAKIKNKINHEK
ncbi:regulator of chromosome condensation [Anaeramoeba flamelloides]|uniref:Regulator of chromosome condensation n=1 Tax=Anaeramoeba flamelloides TaxID=1746091 RepID=A0AAV7YPP6_9EUKA|nr:regulator of chromosome condensation [Anaeramoeba flamelloides]